MNGKSSNGSIESTIMMLRERMNVLHGEMDEFSKAAEQRMMEARELNHEAGVRKSQLGALAAAEEALENMLGKVQQNITGSSAAINATSYFRESNSGYVDSAVEKKEWNR